MYGYTEGTREDAAALAREMQRSPAAKGPVLRLCAWCKREIGDDDNAVGEPLTAPVIGREVTHGICRECEQRELENCGLSQ